MAKLKDKIVGYISPKQRKINTLENKEILLPAIKQVIKNIDLENKKITVHILKGLI